MRLFARERVRMGRWGSGDVGKWEGTGMATKRPLAKPSLGLARDRRGRVRDPSPSLGAGGATKRRSDEATTKPTAGGAARLIRYIIAYLALLDKGRVS